jgi:serine protease Do
MTWLRRMLVLSALLVLTGSAAAQFPKVDIKDSRNNPVIVQAFRSTIAKPSESLVRVLADGKEVAYGTVVEADGYIVTKYDEIRDRQKITVKLRDGKELEAKVVDFEANFDVALLKVDAKNLKPIEWRTSKDAKVGRWVASVGLGEDPVAIGVISVGTRKLVPGDQPPKVINVNAGYLGVGLEAANSGGARVTKVDVKTPAERAGIKVNDIIHEAAGRKILDHETLINTMGRFRAGEKVLLKIKRGEEELELNATLAKRPAAMLGNPQEMMGSELSNRRGGFPIILQHDTVLKPSECGSPIVDLDGKAVGLNIARAGRTETYAIPSEEIQKLLPDLKLGKLGKAAATFKLGPLAKTPEHVLHLGDNLSNKDPISKLGKGRFMKVYDVKLTKGVTYNIEMQSSEIDPFLMLEDPKGKKVADDDDGGGFPNAKIVYTAPEDGDYRIIATTFNTNESGNFTLSVRRQEKK